MSEENKNIVTGFNVISTNFGRNAMHDVTRDDLFDILENMLRVSKAEKLTTILELIANHTTQHPDPHEVRIDQLAESAVDRMYNYWLNQGFRGTLDQFQSCIYKYNVICDFFTLFVGKDESQITSVKNVSDLITDHDIYINDYENINIFTISEKESKWHGIYSGIRLQSDETLEYADPSIPTLEYNENGDPWYEWHIVFPKHLFDSTISIAVDTNNTNYSIKYKILELNTNWENINSPIKVTIADNEFLTYLFKLEYHSVPFKLNDIVTTIDASAVLTDDPNRIDLFRNVAHDNIWYDFFNIGLYKAPETNFSWFANINSTELKNTDTEWFSPKCTFNIAMQAHQNLLVDHKGYPAALVIPVFTLTDGNNTFEIYSKVIGEFTSHIPTTENMVTLGSVYLGINLTWGTDNIRKIITPDIVATNKALYRIMCMCDFTTNTFKIMYNNGSTVSSVSKTYQVAFNLLHPTNWLIKYPAEYTTNAYIGLHELVHYPTIVTDTDFIEKIMFMDMTDIPYVPYRHVDLVDTNFGFSEANYEPFDTYPFAK